MEKSRTLMEIINDLSKLEDELFINEGVFEQEDLDALTIKYEELETKLRAYRFRYKSIQGTRELGKDEVKRLQSRGKAMDNLVEKLKEKMLEAIITFGQVNPKTNGKVLKYDDVTFYTQKSISLVGDFDRFEQDCLFVFNKILEQPDIFNTKESITELIIDVFDLEVLINKVNIEKYLSPETIVNKINEVAEFLLNGIFVQITIKVTYDKLLNTNLRSLLNEYDANYQTYDKLLNTNLRSLLNEYDANYQTSIDYDKKEFTQFLNDDSIELPHIKVQVKQTYRDK